MLQSMLMGVGRVAAALLLAAGLLGPAALAAPTAAARLHPLLAQLAAEAPDQPVGVIVQMMPGTGDAGGLVAGLGGTVTHDLAMINAVAAQVPAGAVPRLATDPAVRWVSPDAPMVETLCALCVDTSQLVSAYIRAVGADQVWNSSSYLQGQGVGVAVVDSGVKGSHVDFSGRVVANVEFNSTVDSANDQYGHGTHVAGIIGGNGNESGGQYIGIAPRANLINVRVTGDEGAGSTADVVAGLQWVLNHRLIYNIRVVNISLNSSVAESYNTSPLNAAVEVLWFNGIVVVVSAGNAGRNALYPPANDPFVITVGATDDRGTPSLADDVVAAYSGAGVTTDGFAKPDLVAPGTNLVAPLPSRGVTLAQRYPNHVVKVGDKGYFRMSGTSMAAPVVAGAAALLLQDEPHLTPDQVKYRLMATATHAGNGWAGYTSQAGAGYLNIAAAVNGTTTQSANTGLPVSGLLAPSTTTTWGSVNWNSVNWNSVNWNSVNWSSDYFGP